jgi:alpha-glucuronidase
VDDHPPNGDTDYVSSSNVGDIDTYAFTQMSHNPSAIYGVQLLIDAKKDDAGTRGVAGVVNVGSSGNVAGASNALSTDYAIYTDIRELNPDTSAAWTKSAFNAANFGLEVSA